MYRNLTIGLLKCSVTHLSHFQFQALLSNHYHDAHARFKDEAMTHSTDYDVLVIGAGPAGLAAATALGRACRQVAVFDSQEYRNEGVEEMHNVVLHDGQKPELYRAAAIKDISSKYPTVTFIDTVVKTATVTATAVSNMHKFQVASAHGGHFRGKKLILATGSKDIFPDIPGYAELWGKGM